MSGSDGARVIGVWDTQVMPPSIGGVLILAAELHALTMIYDLDIMGVCFVGQPSNVLSVSATVVNDNTLTRLDRESCRNSMLISMLLNIQGIDNCYVAWTLNQVHDYVSSRQMPCLTWPGLDVLTECGSIAHQYSTTIFLQRFHAEYGSIPLLSVKEGPMRWALEFIEKHVAPYIPVVVHLKNDGCHSHCSNANFDEWLAFFKASALRHKIKFLIIGNEEIDDRIRTLNNVLVTRDLKSNLVGELALIQVSAAFMGMSSGPCNMAILGAVPYVIYKNPDHDYDQMCIELGKNNQFSFARPCQTLLRVFETKESLMYEMENILAYIDYSD
ncbi:MAG: hypothetical protein SVY53_03510 [Chloroflexota bacterium]|nr:hypothetical protein [Chloroflexota bacterium]